jgi:LuxR family transcriptional regulator, maltose regulon positive regulatory protein
MPSERKSFSKPTLGLIPKVSRFELRRTLLLEAFMVLEDARIVAVVAPSGFGKTIALAQVLRESEAQTVWCSLRPEHSGVKELSQALLNVFAISATSNHSDSDHPDSDHPDQLLRTLSLTLETFTDGLLLVLEGADHLNAEAGTWLLNLAASMRDGQHVVLSGYELEAFPLARLVAEGRAQLFTANDLAFSREETSTYLRSRGFEDDPITTFEALEGWPLGIALVAGGASPGLSPTDLIADTLARLPEPLRSRLPAAAVCETWSEEFAMRLGCELPAGWLAQSRRAGLPLVPLGRHTYKPSKVLIAALEAELRCNPLRHSSLHVAAGHQAFKDGDALRAMTHFLLARREDEAIQLAGRIVPDLLAKYEYRLLRNMLESLPVKELPANLKEALAMALSETGDAARSEVMLRQLRAKGHLTNAGVLTLCKLALVAGEHARALSLTEEGLNTMDRTQIKVAPFLRFQGFALSGLGRHDQALEAALEAIKLAEAHDDLRELGQAMAVAQNELWELGRWPECERMIRRAIEVFTALEEPMRTVGFYNDLANLQCLQDQTEAALITLDGVQAMAEHERNNMLPLLLETRADVLLWRSEFDQASRMYGEAIRHGQDVGMVQLVRYQLKSAEAHWRAGQALEALKLLQVAQHHLPSSTMTIYGRLAFLEGLMMFTQNQLEAAKTHFLMALEHSDDSTQRPRALAFLAEIARRSGSLQETHLKQLAECLHSMPSEAVLNSDQDWLQPLWQECEARGWWPHADQSSSPNLVSPRAVVLDVPLLKVTTFGRMDVRLNDKAVKLPFAKAGELLVWLLLHGPANHEQVIDALWDGSAETKHHEYFRVAVRKLRTALKPEPDSSVNPLPFENGQYTISGLRVSLDVLQLNALEGGDVNALRSALELYKGNFMPGIDSEWVEATRVKSLDQAVAIALTLGENLETIEPREALQAYRRAIELEPHTEAGHLGLIRTQLALGANAAAQQAFTAYTRLLNEEYDLEPSREFQQHLAKLGFVTSV